MEGDRVRAWHHVAAISFAVVCAWFVFRVGQRPPGLTYIDIAVHEIGHLLFQPFGELVMLVMGSGTQVLFPLGLAAFFLLARRDLLSGSVLLAWTGEAVGDTAIYVADAPYGELPLLGGVAEGDWTRVLGPEHLSRMHLADEYARNLRVVGALLMLAAVGVALLGLWRLHRARRPVEPSARPRSLEVGPQRSPEEMWRGA